MTSCGGKHDADGTMLTFVRTVVALPGHFFEVIASGKEVAAITAPALAILPAAFAVPAPPDPIFAAIERHKTARSFSRAESKAVDDYFIAWREKRPVSLVTKADFDRSDAAAAGKIERAALEALHETVPQTLAGIRAFIQYTQPWSVLLK
jgi:hypothetical protein